MLTSEAIKRARQIIGDSEYDYVSANIEVSSHPDKPNDTECTVYVGNTKRGIQRSGRNFKECLFLIEAAISPVNEEDQDDGS